MMPLAGRTVTEGLTSAMGGKRTLGHPACDGLDCSRCNWPLPSWWLSFDRSDSRVEAFEWFFQSCFLRPVLQPRLRRRLSRPLWRRCLICPSLTSPNRRSHGNQSRASSRPWTIRPERRGGAQLASTCSSTNRGERSLARSPNLVGSPQLDFGTCQLLKRRAHFTPAIGRTGNRLMGRAAVQLDWDKVFRDTRVVRMR
jgi:hypothetical protein